VIRIVRLFAADVRRLLTLLERPHRHHPKRPPHGETPEPERARSRFQGLVRRNR
jgi:hypothetical protein